MRDRPVVAHVSHRLVWKKNINADPQQSRRLKHLANCQLLCLSIDNALQLQAQWELYLEANICSNALQTTRSTNRAV